MVTGCKFLISVVLLQKCLQKNYGPWVSLKKSGLIHLSPFLVQVTNISHVDYCKGLLMVSQHQSIIHLAWHLHSSQGMRLKTHALALHKWLSKGMELHNHWFLRTLPHEASACCPASVTHALPFLTVASPSQECLKDGLFSCLLLQVLANHRFQC